MKKLLLGASMLPLLAAGMVAHAADATTSDENELIVTGTRQVGIKAADSAAPIQLVGAQQLLKTGTPDLAEALAVSVPSLNLDTTGGDAAAVQILAALRGLSPNDALVLVDGKRRHPTSNLSVDGDSVFSGSATTDLSYIPVGAIDHIEVLTDGAAAQYGTDAIAGVVNIILKKDAKGGTMTATGGEYYNGEGQTGAISYNQGFNINDKGFVNVTLEDRYHGYSELGIGDCRYTDANGAFLTSSAQSCNGSSLAYPDSNAAKAPYYPYLNRVNGDPEVHLYNAFVNAGYDLGGGVQFYAFGNYSSENAQHYENYRYPSKVEGTTSTDEFVLPFPYGFNPKEKFDETDYSATAGFKGENLGWNWDVSTTYGENKTQSYVIDSANPTEFAQDQAASPTPIVPQTNFYNGEFDATEWTTTVDIDRSFKVGLASPLNVAAGFEARRDTFAIGAGEPSSYQLGGVSSFSGYSPADADSHSRTNYAGYIDLAADPIKNLHMDLAGRYEHYSDFGGTTVGKATVRYDFTPAIAIRGTVSNGFRAPTLAEEYYSGANVGPGYIEVQLPPNSAIAKSLGFPALKPELSQNYSVGFVVHPISNLQITLDAYQINLHDRILVTNAFVGAEGGTVYSQDILNAITARGTTIQSDVTYKAIATFSNAVNTRTDGIELTANYASDFGDYGHVDWSLGFNYNKTQLTKVNALPADVQVPALGQTSYVNPISAGALTTANPREKVILQGLWTKDRFSVTLRETIYGPTSEYANTPINFGYFLNSIGTTGITDLDIGFKVTQFMKVDVGANNLFNTKPPVNVEPAGAGYATYVYKVPYTFAPYNPNGGYYYGRVTVNF